MRVLIHDSHSIFDPALGGLRAYGGAPGESAYVRTLNDRIAAGLTAIGIAVVRVAGDGATHPEFDEDYDAFIAPHYDADIYSHVGGAFWDRAATSATGARDDVLGQTFWRHFRAIPSVPAERFDRRNANTRDYYGFRLTTANTPGIIVEHGVGAPVCNGHGFASAPDYDWSRVNLDAIAGAWVAALAEFGGIATGNPEFSVLGVTGETAEHLMAFARQTNPNIPAEWPLLYAALAPQAGIRTAMAFAQALKETNYFRFTGTAQPEWNNPAGLGVTGGEGVGNRFPTRNAGVRAHLGHLLWYLGPHKPEFCDYDQRHFGGHKNLPDDIRSLNGKWAVPGTTYGETIAENAANIRAFQLPPQPDLWDTRADDTPATLGDLRRYARKLADQLDREFQRKGV